MCTLLCIAVHARQPLAASGPWLARRNSVPRPFTRTSVAGPTAKLEHVTERFASLWTDLEQEKQVGGLTLQCCEQAEARLQAGHAS